MSATWWVRLVQRCVPLFPWSGLWLCYCDQSLPWMLRGAYPWLCGFHCPLCGKSMLPGWWTRAPDLLLSCASICGVRLGGLVCPHWERSHWTLLLPECSLRGVLCVTFHAAASVCVILLLALLLPHLKHVSPCLFNSYAKYIMRHAGLDEAQAGIKTTGRNTNNLRYADDTTFKAECKKS